MAANENFVGTRRRAAVRAATVFALVAGCMGLALAPVGIQSDQSAQGAAARGPVYDHAPPASKAPLSGARGGPGACCLAPYECIETNDDFECMVLYGGFWLGPGTDCGMVVCECFGDQDCEDGDPCTDDYCVYPETYCDHPPSPPGIECGEPDDTDCTDPDTCDGEGMCDPNDEPAGTACDDPSDTECDDPDTCDGVGGCMDNLPPDGTPCDDLNDCTIFDECMQGNCSGTDCSTVMCVDDGDCAPTCYCGPDEWCTCAQQTEGTVEWQPVGATGVHTIVGNDINLEGGGQEVTLELRVSEWAPHLLQTYQAGVDSASYNNGIGDPLNPKGWPGTPEDGGFVDATHPDYVGMDLPACNTTDIDYEWGGTQIFSPPVPDGGGTYYGGTLILEVPENAAGVYTIDFRIAPTIMQNNLGEYIEPLNLVPGTITVKPRTIPPDYHGSPPGMSWVIFDALGDVPPIPVGWFDTDSEEFTGQVDLVGAPVGGRSNGPSTILQRTADPVAVEDPIGHGGTADIELVALRLVSTLPIAIAYPDLHTEYWDLEVGLSPTPVSWGGEIYAEKMHDNGGWYNITVNVQPLLTFTRQSDGMIKELDTALEGLGPYELGGTGEWVHTVSPDLDVPHDPSAQWVGGVAETVPGDPTSQVALDMSVEPFNGLRWLVHGVGPPPPPPPDYHGSPPGMSWVIFGADVDFLPPIPAGWFDTDSEEFIGQVDLGGAPIAGRSNGEISTVLLRPADPIAVADPVGTVGWADIELVDLRLVSSLPIAVEYGGPTPHTEYWDLEVGLSPTPVAWGGEIYAEKMHDNGGWYNITINVQPLLTFTRQSDGMIKELDTELEGLGPYELGGTGEWVHTVSPDLDVPYDPSAQWVGGVAETDPGDPTSQVALDMSVEPFDGLRWLVHGVGPPPPPPPPPPDYHGSPPGKSWVIFDDASTVPPIPAGWFGQDSEEFTGQVDLEGAQIAGRSNGTSTVLQRTADPIAVADPPGTMGWAEIELVALNLVSSVPIAVDFVGLDPHTEYWNVQVGIAATPVPIGELTAEKTHDNGGWYDIRIFVQPLLTFTRQSDGEIRVLDTGLEGIPPYELYGMGDWVHEVNPELDIPYDPSAQWVGGVVETVPGDPTSQVAQDMSVEPYTGLRWLGHGVGPPPPPPPPPDYHGSPPGMSWVIFDYDGDVQPIPDDFFGQGSDPYVGQVDLEGDPIDLAATGDSSTVLQRPGDPVAVDDPPGTMGSVEIELVALSLKSSAPITVTYNGGQNPEDWNLHVGLSTTPVVTGEVTGELTAEKMTDNGGTYDIMINVRPLLTFERVSDGLTVELDTTVEGVGPYELHGNGHFVHTVSPHIDVYYDPSAQWVGGIEETVDGDPGSQVAEDTSLEPINGLRWLIHGVGPPPPLCPLPAGDSACAALQTRDCEGPLDQLCRPLQAQIQDGIAVAIQCACLETGIKCGPIDIAPGGDAVYCPGGCPFPNPPGLCVIHADGVSTGTSSLPTTAFSEGAIITCDCPGGGPPPDPHNTLPGLGTTSTNFGNQVIPPIPQDFFGPGSMPFEGDIEFEGTPIDPETYGEASTLIVRSGDPIDPGDPEGTEGEVSVELVALSLRSIGPIIVYYGRGGGELWDVEVSLSDISPGLGSLRATKTHCNGGTFDMDLYVNPVLTFTQVANRGVVRVLDAAAQGEPPLELTTVGAPWVHSLWDPDVSIDAPSDGTFVPGVEETPPCSGPGRDLRPGALPGKIAVARAGSFDIPDGVIVSALSSASREATFGLRAVDLPAGSPEGVRQTDCPPDSLFAAPPQLAGWTAGTSEVDVNGSYYLRYETFPTVAGPICDLHWWGLNLWHDGNQWNNCDENPMPFEIKFYLDAGGLPGPEVCSYTAVLTGTIVADLSGYTLYEYNVDLDPCCVIPDGWVSIQASGDPLCWFLWHSSAVGDASNCFDDGTGGGLICGPPDHEYDLSMCLTPAEPQQQIVPVPLENPLAFTWHGVIPPPPRQVLEPPELPTDPTHQVRKNRYISVNPKTNPNTDTVLKVEVAEMRRCQNAPTRSCLVDSDCDDVCDDVLSPLPHHMLKCPPANCASTVPPSLCIWSGPCVDLAP
ncbi:MAG: hypothetical protein ACYTFA_03045, partial [Planctomycetota bacterium]